jgi:hypothetical protein
MEDPFLNYFFALGMLFFVVIVLVYGIIAIHDIPARIAHARHHPHEDAIHAAGWISLFMLHVLWPFLWIWAMMYPPDRGWGFAHKPGEPTSPKEAVAELEELRHRLAEVEARLEILARPAARAPCPLPPAQAGQAARLAGLPILCLANTPAPKTDQVSRYHTFSANRYGLPRPARPG